MPSLGRFFLSTQRLLRLSPHSNQVCIHYKTAVAWMLFFSEVLSSCPYIKSIKQNPNKQNGDFQQKQEKLLFGYCFVIVYLLFRWNVLAHRHLTKRQTIPTEKPLYTLQWNIRIIRIMRNMYELQQ
jgi:hypothetical protein